MILKKKTQSGVPRTMERLPTKQQKPVSVESEEIYDDEEDTDVDADETYKRNPKQASAKSTQRPQTASKPKVGGSVGGGDKSSLADRLNVIAKSFSNNASDVPPGMYEAIISEAVMQAPDAKGQSVRLKFELCDPEFQNKNQIAQWYRIFDADGEPFAGGIKSLMYNFARLGFELSFEGETQEEVSDNLQEQLDEAIAEKPGIIAKVVNNPGNDGRVFTNVSVEKICDNDIVQAYKDNVPY